MQQCPETGRRVTVKGAVAVIQWLPNCCMKWVTAYKPTGRLRKGRNLKTAQTMEARASYLQRLILQLGERRTEPRRESP